MLRTNGSKATELTPLPKEVTESPLACWRRRTMSNEEFLERHASGTLRKNARLGFDYAKQLLAERVAFDFGYEFESLDETYVNWGVAFTECNTAPLTETGWFVDRYVFVAFPGDEFEVKHIVVSSPNGSQRSGVGLVVRKTSAPYIPRRHVVFAIIAEIDEKTGEYKQARNPC